MHRIVVVLPAPFGPRKPVTLPASMPNVRSSTAVFSPYRFVRPCTSIMNMVLSLVMFSFWRFAALARVTRSDDSAYSSGGMPSGRPAPATRQNASGGHERMGHEQPPRQRRAAWVRAGDPVDHLPR